jgi:probable F420-dependent oxidoreductase
MTKPFRFACQSYRPTSGRQWRELARRVEDLGFSTLHVADHIIGPGPMLGPSAHNAQTVGVIPAMAVAAAVTSTLRVGSRLICAAYRHPALLAKDAATIDLLSDGRFEFGLGAGWLANEFAALGIAFDPPGKRIDRLRETLDVVEQCFSGEQVDYRGEYVQVHGFQALPAPVQTPRPPIMVGGGGRRILQLAGQRADIVSINFNNRSGGITQDSVVSSTADETHRKLAWVREGAGDRFADLELEIAAYFVAVDGEGGAVERLTSDLKLPAAELQTFPHALIGSVGEICDELQRRRDEFGFSYITIGDSVLESFAPVVAKLAGS